MITRRDLIIACSAVGGAALLAGVGDRARASGRDVSASDPASAFRAGQWQRAASLASNMGTADGFALAARARLAPILLAGALRADPAALQAARDNAREALRLQPRHVDGRLQLATALGIEARRMAAPLALTRRLPQQIRAIASQVAADAPANAWAVALLGTWHLEGVRLGGAAARTLLGASDSAGRQLFQRAIALAPSDPVIPFQYCATLLALQEPGLLTEARAVLAQAVARPATDAFQREISQRARQLDQTWSRSGPDACRSMVSAWL